MLALRAVAGQSPAVAQTLPDVLQRLAGVRQAVGVDAPQQLMDFTAPPAGPRRRRRRPSAVAPAPAVGGAERRPGGPGRRPDPGRGRRRAGRRARAAAPAGRDAPAGRPARRAGRSASRGAGTWRRSTPRTCSRRSTAAPRASSSTTCAGWPTPTTTRPATSRTSVQVYIFEMGSPLKALGKYGSEKPDEVEALPIGTEGYTLGRQHPVLRGPVLHPDRLDEGRPEVRRLRPGAGQADRRPAEARGADGLASAAAAEPAAGPATPEALFALLPAGPSRPAPKYVAQDVFGYSFLSDVFMADYQEGDVTWQGFLRPYPDADAAQKVFEQVSRGGQDRTRPRSRWSRPRGPTGWSSAPISAWSTSSS